MRAVVLVGGFGTRLQPLTFTTPKPLLPVVNRPIVERVLANLARGGVTEAVLAIGFRPDAFLDVYPDGACAGVPLRYAVEAEPLDTAGAVRFAAADAGFGDETLVVVNGDVLTDLDVGALVAYHRASGGEGTIHLTPVEDPSAFGVVPTEADGRVVDFIEKPPRESAPTNAINAGTYVLEPAALERIALGRRVSIEREIFPAMAADRVLFAKCTDDYWLDAGRPDQYLAANLDVIDGARRSGPEPGVAPGVVLDARAKVHRAAIGDGSVIGAGAHVTESVLLPEVRVGAGAVVTRSLLGRGVVVGGGSELRDAVIGDAVEIEPGARLDGVRRPEAAT